MFDERNLCLLLDSYKITQWQQYPPNTTNIYSHRVPRGGLFEAVTDFGLTYSLKKYFQTPVTRENVAEAYSFCADHFGSVKIFNWNGWQHVLNKHGGFIPLRIKSVPEGMTIPVKNVFTTIENTCPECYWVTNYFETLLMQSWYPATVCTYSRECKKVIKKYLELTADTLDGLEFKLVDFGVRGVGTMEEAEIGGMAHLVNFKSTDNMPSIMKCRQYYNERMAGFSIPASEHSTIVSWEQGGEVDAYANMISKYSDQPLYACVSDSYDINRACDEYWGKILKNKVLAGKGTLVVRPDSGDPVDVDLECLESLGRNFGVSVNSKGYKVLHPKVRLIQGDRVDYFMIGEILEEMMRKHWSAENISFGSGGKLLQDLNRDTQEWKIACSSAVVEGNERPVFKSPKNGNKTSKKGRLGLYTNGVTHDGKQHYITREEGRHDDILQLVYENGELFNTPKFSEIRERAAV